MADEGNAARDAQLTRLRSELDAIDSRIVEALADRLRVIGVIAAFKETQTDQIRDEGRERQLLETFQRLQPRLGRDGKAIWVGATTMSPVATIFCFGNQVTRSPWVLPAPKKRSSTGVFRSLSIKRSVRVSVGRTA